MLYVILALQASLTLAAPPTRCDFPAPVQRPYRAEPNEDEVALATLLGHFKRHPYRDPGDACVTLPGYRPATAAIRSALTSAGVKVTSDPDCRFVGGALVWCADGVWRTSADIFVVHVRKLAFDDISTFVGGYEYTLSRRDGQWTIDKERESPCNKSREPAPQDGKRP